jgi:NAD(P)-dependent dehydrogenase (short-subunit alcohol dehydrogenase family)
VASYKKPCAEELIPMRVKDKVAIITGGASGIGEAVAFRLADEGAKIAIVDVDIELANKVADNLKSKKAEAIALKADVSKKAEVEAAVREVVSHFKRIDILVNDAGISFPVKVSDITEEMWDRVLDINLKGYFLMIQAVLPQMQKQSYGKILNIASIGIYGGGVDRAHYISSKAGIVGLTRTLALELSPFKINVNAVAPGVVETPMTKKSGFIEQFKDLLAQAIPLGRVAQPQDIANAVLFFVSDEAEYITGQCLPVCGGASLGSKAT